MDTDMFVIAAVASLYRFETGPRVWDQRLEAQMTASANYD